MISKYVHVSSQSTQQWGWLRLHKNQTAKIRLTNCRFTEAMSRYPLLTFDLIGPDSTAQECFSVEKNGQELTLKGTSEGRGLIAVTTHSGAMLLYHVVVLAEKTAKVRFFRLSEKSSDGKAGSATSKRNPIVFFNQDLPKAVKYLKERTAVTIDPLHTEFEDVELSQGLGDPATVTGKDSVIQEINDIISRQARGAEYCVFFMREHRGDPGETIQSFSIIQDGDGLNTAFVLAHEFGHFRTGRWTLPSVAAYEKMSSFYSVKPLYEKHDKRHLQEQGYLFNQHAEAMGELLHVDDAIAININYREKRSSKDH